MLYSIPGQESPDALLLHSRAAFSLFMLSCENSVTHGNPKPILFVSSIKSLLGERAKGYKQ